MRWGEDWSKFYGMSSGLCLWLASSKSVGDTHVACPGATYNVADWALDGIPDELADILSFMKSEQQNIGSEN
jgi:hypothetical protein